VSRPSRLLLLTLGLFAGTASDSLTADGAQVVPRGGASGNRVGQFAADPLAQPLSLAPAQLPPAARDQARPALDVGISTLVGGLAVCIGSFLLFVWATRRAVPPGLAPLPEEVFEPLGRASLSGRHQLQLVRLGRKVVLLCVSPTGATALAELSDDDEVTRLTGLCRQSRSGSATSSFREAIGDFSRESAATGWLGRKKES
jgi:flagellar biogenesis protein FliO